MEKIDQQTVKETVKEFLEKLGFSDVEVAVREREGGLFECAIATEQDQNLLIGQYGVNLAAIQHLVHVLLRKKSQERFRVTIDVNGYFSEKKSFLEQEAQKAAEKTLREGSPVTLRPMPSYERKIVHSFLSENSAVVTESTGSGSERRVVIRPQPEKTNFAPLD